MGLPATPAVRVEDVVQLLTTMAPNIACVLKRLLELEVLTAELGAVKAELANQSAV